MFLFVCFVLPFSSTCDCSIAPPPPPPLLKELEAHDQEELLQEDLRVQHGDVGGSAYQGVGCVGQGVDDIIAHQVAVFVLEHRQQQVLDHLRIHRACGGEEGGRGRCVCFHSL